VEQEVENMLSLAWGNTEHWAHVLDVRGPGCSPGRSTVRHELHNLVLENKQWQAKQHSTCDHMLWLAVQGHPVRRDGLHVGDYKACAVSPPAEP
jgi:hypothetical protein